VEEDDFQRGHSGYCPGIHQSVLFGLLVLQKSNLSRRIDLGLLLHRGLDLERRDLERGRRGWMGLGRARMDLICNLEAGDLKTGFVEKGLLVNSSSMMNHLLWCFSS